MGTLSTQNNITSIRFYRYGTQGISLLNDGFSLSNLDNYTFKLYDKNNNIVEDEDLKCESDKGNILVKYFNPNPTSNNPGGSNYGDVTGIAISPKTLKLHVGDTYQLLATVFPENTPNKTVYWSITGSGSGGGNNYEEELKPNPNNIITTIINGKSVSGENTRKVEISSEAQSLEITVKSGTPWNVILLNIYPSSDYENCLIDNSSILTLEEKIITDGYNGKVTIGIPKNDNDGYYDRHTLVVIRDGNEKKSTLNLTTIEDNKSSRILFFDISEMDVLIGVRISIPFCIQAIDKPSSFDFQWCVNLTNRINIECSDNTVLKIAGVTNFSNRVNFEFLGSTYFAFCIHVSNDDVYKAGTVTVKISLKDNPSIYDECIVHVKSTNNEGVSYTNFYNNDMHLISPFNVTVRNGGFFPIWRNSQSGSIINKNSVEIPDKTVMSQISMSDVYDITMNGNSIDDTAAADTFHATSVGNYTFNFYKNRYIINLAQHTQDYEYDQANATGSIVIKYNGQNYSSDKNIYEGIVFYPEHEINITVAITAANTSPKLWWSYPGGSITWEYVSNGDNKDIKYNFNGLNFSSIYEPYIRLESSTGKTLQKISNLLYAIPHSLTNSSYDILAIKYRPGTRDFSGDNEDFYILVRCSISGFTIIPGANWITFDSYDNTRGNKIIKGHVLKNDTGAERRMSIIVKSTDSNLPNYQQESVNYMQAAYTSNSIWAKFSSVNEIILNNQTKNISLTLSNENLTIKLVWDTSKITISNLTSPYTHTGSIASLTVTSNYNYTEYIECYYEDTLLTKIAIVNAGTENSNLINILS